MSDTAEKPDPQAEAEAQAEAPATAPEIVGSFTRLPDMKLVIITDQKTGKQSIGMPFGKQMMLMSAEGAWTLAALLVAAAEEIEPPTETPGVKTTLPFGGSRSDMRH